MTVMHRRRDVLAGATALLAAPAWAQKLALTPQHQARSGVSLNLRDLAPRFLDFYAAAQGLAPDARFAVWKARYDFAAVPPTPAGDAMARKLLDQAWPRYAGALPRIRAGADGMRPPPLDTAVAVADLLQAPRPLGLGLTTYVGAFETNAFTIATAQGPVVSLPLEIEEDVRALLLPHEMTHAVHMLTAGLSTGYERSLARLVFEEGLAMHVTRALKPGLPDWRYVGEEPWFVAALAQRAAILDAISRGLDRSDGETLFKFTMGNGATGREREAYVAGWLVTGALLREGHSLPELARVAEADMPALVRRIIAAQAGQ